MKVWVNGCFDILHTGHLELLKTAKSMGRDPENNILIVGIDSDRRVKELKGDNRPINSQEDRKKMLESLRFVDKVVIFDTSKELCQLVKDFEIDQMIVGTHYMNKEVIGSEHARMGVSYYPVNSRSTTNIIERIKNL